MDRGFLILVEGNIGCGKTTLVQGLKPLLPRCRVVMEPALDDPLLPLFYEDPIRYALPFQMKLLKARHENYLHSIRLVEAGHTVLMDRSVFSDVVFAKKNTLDGNISSDGMESYLAEYEMICSEIPRPDCILYLDVAAEECRRRIACRSRECEQAISTDYLEGIQAGYRELVSSFEDAGDQVWRLDWQNFGRIGDRRCGPREIAERLINLLKKTASKTEQPRNCTVSETTSV